MSETIQQGFKLLLAGMLLPTAGMLLSTTACSSASNDVDPSTDTAMAGSDGVATSGGAGMASSVEEAGGAGGAATSGGVGGMPSPGDASDGAPSLGASGSGGGAMNTSGSGGNSAAGAGGSSVGSGGVSGMGGSGGSGGGKSAGCGRTGKTGDQYPVALDVSGTARTYYISVPSNYSNTVPEPLYVAFHGHGGNGQGMSIYGLSQNSIGVYPDGIYNGAGWDTSLTGKDVAMFDALITAIEASYCIDTSRIYATGFSYGASMANTVACARGNVLRAFSEIDGGILFKNGTCQRPIPAWLNHYTEDPTDPYLTDGIPNRDFFVNLNMGTNPVAYDAPNPCVKYSGLQPVVWCTPPGAFHQWPDFATAAMKRFFESL